MKTIKDLQIGDKLKYKNADLSAFIITRINKNYISLDMDVLVIQLHMISKLFNFVNKDGSEEEIEQEEIIMKSEITQEEHNKKQYDKDESNHDCGYWSVCDDHACGCSPTAKVSQGFNNEVYEDMRKDIQKQYDEYDW
jgi:hypothetical protein